MVIGWINWFEVEAKEPDIIIVDVELFLELIGWRGDEMGQDDWYWILLKEAL